MKQAIKDLYLPDFAFLAGWGREDETLHGRNVIMHVRSASVVEMLDEEDVLALREGVLTHKFDYINRWGVVEHHVAVLHHSATLDEALDAEMIRKKVLVPAVEWYARYLEWEDENIAKEGL